MNSGFTYMRIDFKILKRLSVETVSGTILGHVHELEIEIDGHLIVQYKVKSSILGQRHYFINRAQVVSIDDKKMIVDDSVAKVTSGSRLKASAPGVEPVSMRKEV